MFTPTPTLPQREREKQSFRTGTAMIETSEGNKIEGSLKVG
jgi:hypothetical protein